MQKTLHKPKVNPLSNLMRQPKLQVKLPSRGIYWDEGSIDFSENNEYDVFSMTAKDEIALKNPVALANGQALVSIIQSCIPSIKNAWSIPSIDLDALLVAIRIATYGNILKSPVTVNNVLFSVDVDLSLILDQLYNDASWDEELVINDDLKIYIKPLSYKTIAKAGLEALETQKIMSVVNDDEMSEDRKLELFKNSFNKLSQYTLSTVADSISRVESGEEVVENEFFIKEFVEQCDRELFNIIKNKIDTESSANSVKPVKVKATDEIKQISKEEEIEVTVEFTPTNFFL